MLLRLKAIVISCAHDFGVSKIKVFFLLKKQNKVLCAMVYYTR